MNTVLENEAKGLRTEELEPLAAQRQMQAHALIRALHLVEAWESVGAEVHLEGSLRMGLMMTHRDIDFHIYSSSLSLAEGCRVMAQIAEHPAIERIECLNGIQSEEHCVEWHVWCRDAEEQLWQIDMIHILKGSNYDGYFERMADQIVGALTAQSRAAILRLKYETPEQEKISGVEYYQAVLRDGVRSYAEFEAW
ncbi:MAG: phosphoglycerate mutase family protein, partial [Alistipes sp.]|nr:phosphoglycerate mutase family protein [Alistipes sp.]